MVGPLPIVNAPGHEYETLWTVILRCKAMTRLRNGKYMIITMDEGLYNKAKMLQWAKTEEFKNVIVVLGGFHTQMTFTKVIGKYLESSGISDIWTESEVFGETTAENILKGKLWNRVVRAHKLSYEALWRVLWPILTSWAKDNGKDDALAEFDGIYQEHSSYWYWRQYMHMVSILLRFTRAIREGVLKPKLINQEEVSASCLQLAFCGCSSSNSCINRRCTCVRMSLGCSKGCKCGDACRNISLDEEEV